MKDRRNEGPSKFSLFWGKVKEFYTRPYAWILTCLAAAVILAVILIIVLIPHGSGNGDTQPTETSAVTVTSDEPTVTTTLPKGETTAAPTASTTAASTAAPTTAAPTVTTTAAPTAAPTKATVKSTTAAPTAAPTNPPSPSGDPFQIAQSMIGRPIAELIEIIGPPLSVDHDSSCDVPGEQDGFYTFDGFIVVTLSDHGVDKIREVGVI